MANNMREGDETEMETDDTAMETDDTTTKTDDTTTKTYEKTNEKTDEKTNEKADEIRVGNLLCSGPNSAFVRPAALVRPVAKRAPAM
eukprot:1654812-Rhodomonas_salina.1